MTWHPPSDRVRYLLIAIFIAAVLFLCFACVILVRRRMKIDKNSANVTNNSVRRAVNNLSEINRSLRQQSNVAELKRSKYIDALMIHDREMTNGERRHLQDFEQALRNQNRTLRDGTYSAADDPLSDTSHYVDMSGQEEGTDNMRNWSVQKRDEDTHGDTSASTNVLFESSAATQSVNSKQIELNDIYIDTEPAFHSLPPNERNKLPSNNKTKGGVVSKGIDNVTIRL